MTQPLRVLLDSSFLFALNSPNDKNHRQSLKVAALPIRQYIVPDIVLAETAHMLRQRIGSRAVLNFLDQIVSSSIDLIPILKPELQRAREIMNQYEDADFDLADCCIMAFTEQLNIRYVCTFDERDFRQFRPKNFDYLTLLPADIPS